MEVVARTGDAVSGSVVDPEGPTIANAVLAIEVEGGTRDSEYTGRTGEFALAVPCGAHVRIAFSR